MIRFSALLNNRDRFSSYVLYAFFLTLCIVFCFFSPIFLTTQNIINILLATATIGILTIAAAFIVGSGGLDLSVGSIMAFAAAISGVLAAKDASWVAILFFALLSGAFIGFINGALIGFARMPAFIVTLGTLSIARGLALIVSDGRPYYGLPKQILFFGQGSFLMIPIPVYILIIFCVMFHQILRKTAFGIRTVCIGDNEDAVFKTGINVSLHKLILYVFSGVMAAIAGILFMSRVNAADPSAGLTYELSAITAVIIGGTPLSGGKATVVGAFIGALTISVLQNGLTLLAIPSYYQQVIVGTILIVAVAFDRFAKGRS